MTGPTCFPPSAPPRREPAESATPTGQDTSDHLGDSWPSAIFRRQIDVPNSKTAPLTHITEDTWRKQGLWAVLMANTNSWHTAAKLLLPFASDDILLLQETRIFRDRFRRVAANAARKVGSCFQFGPSHARDRWLCWVCCACEIWHRNFPGWTDHVRRPV